LKATIRNQPPLFRSRVLEFIQEAMSKQKELLTLSKLVRKIMWLKIKIPSITYTQLAKFSDKLTSEKLGSAFIKKQAIKGQLKQLQKLI
jgi:hypothetical protein